MSSSINTQYPIITNQKQFFRKFCKCICKKQIRYLHKYSDSAMRLKLELRCIMFPLIILEMFLQLDWSPPVVNSIDWT